MQNLFARRWSRKKLIIISAILLLILLIIFIKLITGPAVGTITVDNSSQATPANKIFEDLDGQYFYMSYPSNYRLENTGKHAVNVLESYHLQAAPQRGGLTRIAAVTIYSEPTGDLSQNSNYRLRIEEPEKYQEKVRNVNGYDMHFITNTTVPETVVFIQKGTKVAAVAFSGGVTQEGAQPEFDHMIQSWKWK